MSSVTFTISETKSGLQPSPTSAVVTSSNTDLVFVLDGSAAVDYCLTGYTATDHRGQLGSAKISTDGTNMVVADANTAAETMNINVTVVHRKHQTTHIVDPEVTNEPP